MISVRVVPPEFVPQTWGSVAPWLSECIQYGQDDYGLEHIQLYLSSGQWVLVIAEADGVVTGAAAVQFFNRPTSRIAFICALGGTGVLNETGFTQLKEICKQYGATHVEGAVRESVARMCRRVGMVEKYRIVGAQI